jgi:hypothetical protein
MTRRRGHPTMMTRTTMSQMTMRRRKRRRSHLMMMTMMTRMKDVLDRGEEADSLTVMPTLAMQLCLNRTMMSRENQQKLRYPKMRPRNRSRRERKMTKAEKTRRVKDAKRRKGQQLKAENDEKVLDSIIETILDMVETEQKRMQAIEDSRWAVKEEKLQQTNSEKYSLYYSQKKEKTLKTKEGKHALADRADPDFTEGFTSAEYTLKNEDNDISTLQSENMAILQLRTSQSQ